MVERGGNAVDAAVSAALVSVCTDLGLICPGCSGFITVWPAGAEPVVIDAYAAVPGLGLSPKELAERDLGREILVTYGRGLHARVGYGSIAVPGGMAGLAAAAASYGRLPWSRLVDPAAELAEAGFALPRSSACFLKVFWEVFSWHPLGRSVLQRSDGSPLSPGDWVRIPGLADTLRRIAAEGPGYLYRGELGERVADDVLAHGGRLTRRDLERYRVERREPIRVRTDGWDVAVNPLPALGGVALAAMLLLLEQRPLRDWSPSEVRRLVQVQRAVVDFRREELDPVLDLSEPAARLLAASAGERRESSGATIQASAVDSDGLACSITMSAGCGSGALIGDTGLWMNNSLGELRLLVGDGRDLEPGTRLRSNMTPTIARSDEGAVLAVGTPGGSRITTSLLQVLANLIHLGLPLEQAIAHPRLHVERPDGVASVACEPGIALEELGSERIRRYPERDMFFGGVQAALLDPVQGLSAAADPRRDGATWVSGQLRQPESAETTLGSSSW
jgi:gamma-glutamyltranspeptidase/glutathione hydrolase